MAIAFQSEEKYRRAKEVAGDNDEELIKEYKRLGGVYTEGTNGEIDVVKKVAAIYDPEKKKKTHSKKLGGVSKKKKKK